jgi:hypothetical protein
MVGRDQQLFYWQLFGTYLHYLFGRYLLYRDANSFQQNIRPQLHKEIRPV